jgi:hypothetical protein
MWIRLCSILKHILRHTDVRLEQTNDKQPRQETQLEQEDVRKKVLVMVKQLQGTIKKLTFWNAGIYVMK